MVPRAVVLALAAVLLGACGGDGGPSVETPVPDRGSEAPAPASRLSIRTAGGASAGLAVAIADDDAERAQGLMGVEDLPDDRGMAFLWDEPTTTTFWMKDTLLPLSIAFWDDDGRIVEILDMEPCRATPCPSYGPDEPYVGAVEANVGWFAEHGVAVGDRVELEVRADA